MRIFFTSSEGSFVGVFFLPFQYSRFITQTSSG